MSKWSILLIDKNWLIVFTLLGMVSAFAWGWDSERSKRIELEAENKQLVSGLVWEQIHGDAANCERWKLVYYWRDDDKFDSIVITHPNSLLAVPPKASFPETNLIIREPLDWQAASDMLRKMLFEDSSEADLIDTTIIYDSSEVTE